MNPRLARWILAAATALVAVVALAKPALLLVVGVALAVAAVAERIAT